MSAMNTLHDLMVHQIKDLYSAERQLVQALPKMAKAATAPALQEAIETHLEQTQEQLSRLEQALELLGESTRVQKCKGMEGLIEEGKEMLDAEADPEVLDAGIIAAAQRVEHYEIAGYGTVVEFARVMGHDEVRALLEQTLEEEKQTDALLSSLAEGGINALAERDGQVDMEGEETEEESPTGAASKARRATAGSGRGKPGSRRRTNAG
jgi:ferritin-like metal-binding protein YciE